MAAGTLLSKHDSYKTIVCQYRLPVNLDMLKVISHGLKATPHRFWLSTPVSQPICAAAPVFKQALQGLQRRQCALSFFFLRRRLLICSRAITSRVGCSPRSLLQSLEVLRAAKTDMLSYGCGSKLNRRGKPQVLVHVSTYQGSILAPVF